MPPYWSLGFHLCRYGYNTMDNLRTVHQRMVANQIPQDTQWNDIDYMDQHKDFTIDPNQFGDLPKFVDDLRSKGMHYILMLVSKKMKWVQPLVKNLVSRTEIFPITQYAHNVFITSI